MVLPGCLLTLLLSTIIAGSYGFNKFPCPPACSPPKKITGCSEYVKVAHCVLDVQSVGESEADCACFWQLFIRSVEPAFHILSRSPGRQCHTWAANKCEYLKKSRWYLKHHRKYMLSKVESPGLPTAVREIVKKRRRNGVPEYTQEITIVGAKSVGFHPGKTKTSSRSARRSKPAVLKKNKPRKTGAKDFIGRAHGGSLKDWIEVMPTKSKTHKRQAAHHRHHGHRHKHKATRHWVDVNMGYDQFKLVVLLIILLLNVIMVMLLILCRHRVRQNLQRESLPMGDLDPAAYMPPKERDNPFKTQQKMDRGNGSSGFFAKLSSLFTSKKKKPKQSFQFVPLNETPAKSINYMDRYVQDNMRQPTRMGTRGLYEHIDDDVFEYPDDTYEVPMNVPPMRRDTHPKRMQTDSFSEDSSPTKYFPSERSEQARNVSFNIPSASYTTEGGSRPKRGRGGGLSPFIGGHAAMTVLPGDL